MKATSAFSQTTINAGGGGDTVDIGFRDPASGQLPPVHGDVTVYGDAGNDTITVGNGNVANILGDLTIVGGEDSYGAHDADALLINDQDTYARQRQYTVTGIEVTVEPAGFKGTSVSYATMESLQLNTGEFDPLPPGEIKPPLAGGEIRVEGTADGVDVSINAGVGAGEGADRILVEASGLNSAVAVFGNAGKDEITIAGSALDETASYWAAATDQQSANSLHAIGPGYMVHADSVEIATLSSGGGSDQGFLYGAPGDDRFVGRQKASLLTDAATFANLDEGGLPTAVSSYYARMAGFNTVTATANPTEGDVALLYASAGDHTFASYPHHAYFYDGADAAKKSFFVQADDFSRVDMFGTQHGWERGYFYDSDGSDTFNAAFDSSTMAGTAGGVAYSNAAHNHFDLIVGVAGNGGSDTARLADNLARDDTVILQPGYVELRASASQTIDFVAANFDDVTAESLGGDDTAVFHDSKDDDRFVAAEQLARMTGTTTFGNGVTADYAIAAEGFENLVHHMDAGGLDTTIIDDHAPSLTEFSGSWNVDSSVGYDGNHHASASKNSEASWTFSVTPGWYRVAATWAPNSNRLAQARYQLADDASTVQSKRVDQRDPPTDFVEDGIAWHWLRFEQADLPAEVIFVEGTTLEVTLAARGRGVAVADAVRVERVGEPIFVTSTGDTGPGSLRWAIDEANNTPGPNSILFDLRPSAQNAFEDVDADLNLPGSDPQPDVFVIRPLSALPALNDPTGGTRIDGLSQTRLGGDTNPFGPEIVLDGSQATGSYMHGLLINRSDQNEIQGLNIRGFSGDGIHIYVGHDNFVTGNYIGTDATGTKPAANGWTNQQATGGMTLSAGASGNILEGNLVSGNHRHGIRLQAHITSDGLVVSTRDNTIRNNAIGTDAAGEISEGLGNQGNGIVLLGVPGTLVEGNIIAGNQQRGLYIIGEGADENIVVDNKIVSNAVHGVVISNYADSSKPDGPLSNQIGVDGRGNVISGNGYDGIRLNGAGARDNAIVANHIGTAVDDVDVEGNGANGVRIEWGASSNRVARNVISGNAQHGVFIRGAGSDRNVIADNFIGTDATGVQALGNGVYGIALAAPGNVTVGPQFNEIDRNVVSANRTGIALLHGADNTIVRGNYIGTDLSGQKVVDDDGNRLGNARDGIEIFSDNNVIGGATAALRNVISGNLDDGIDIDRGSGNVVLGNHIGADASGTLALGNGSDGIVIGWVGREASRNIIGGPAPGWGNLIMANAGVGVHVAGPTSVDNTIRGNSIHSNGGLGIDLGSDGATPNDDDGTDDDDGPNHLQNYPELQYVQGGSTTQVTGLLRTSTPNAAVLLDFYASKVDSIGAYEGERHLGWRIVETDGDGQARFNLNLSTATRTGEVVTGTATDAAGNTSEFSPGVSVVRGPASGGSTNRSRG